MPVPKVSILDRVDCSCKMSAPKKEKVRNQRTLNNFFPTLEAANTDNTLQAMDTDNQDSNRPENCDNDTATLPAKKTERRND